MEESLTSVNAEQVSDGGSQVETSVDNTQVEQVDNSVSSENVEVAAPQQDNKQVQSAEENANYAKIRREAEYKARQKARDEWVAEQNYSWNGKPITTEEAYKQALYEQELVEKGQDPQEVQRLIDEHPVVKQAKEMAAKQEAEARTNADLRDFVDKYPEVKAQDVPKEVWIANANGIPLRYAYADYLVSQQKIAESKAKANAQTAKSSMGSVTGQGEVADVSFIPFDAYEKNKSDRSWVNKNFKKIMESRAKW